MAEPSNLPPFLPQPLSRVLDDHLRAWSALATAAAEVVNLPARTAGILAGAAPARPAAPDAAEARADVLAARLAEANGHVAALEARLQELGEAHAAQVEALRRAYDVLDREAGLRAAQAVDDQRLKLYQALEPLLTQLPLVRHVVAAGREVAATDLLDLLGPLDEALGLLGLVAIGAVGEDVDFDPTRHQVVGGAAPEAGAAVTVKHPGYQLDDRILRRARVARTS